MGAPPVLTAQQRADALAKAAASRKRRAEVKSKIKSGDYTIDTVLELAQNDDAVGENASARTIGSTLWRWKSASTEPYGEIKHLANP